MKINRNHERTGRIGTAIVLGFVVTGTMGVISTAGCGGSNDGSSTTAISTATNQKLGRATITVRWPAPSRLIPFAANSIKINLFRNDALVGESLLVRPASGGSATATFERLPLGNVIVRATAFPDAQGGGVAQATGDAPVAIVADQPATVSVTMNSTIDHIDMSPVGPEILRPATTATVTATPKNGAGEVVLTNISTWQWKSSNEAIATVDASGKVTTLAPGEVDITATEKESGKVGTVRIVVSTSTPTPPPPATPTPPTPTPPPATPTSVSLSVSPKGDIWLAGMPDGSKVNGDVAPAQSPSQVLGLNIAQGGYLVFSATGAVDNNNGTPSPQANYPDGGYSDGNFEFGVHLDGAQNGIADVRAPVNALMGVFINDSRPDTMLAPEPLDFTNNLSYTQLSPMLNQPFFIGDGLTGVNTNTGQVQQVKIPAGATRLFIGSMDPYGNYNNGGGFTVKVTHHPL